MLFPQLEEKLQPSKPAPFNSHLRSNFGKTDSVVHEKNTSSILLGVTD